MSDLKKIDISIKKFYLIWILNAKNRFESNFEIFVWNLFREIGTKKRLPFNMSMIYFYNFHNAALLMLLYHEIQNFRSYEKSE